MIDDIKKTQELILKLEQNLPIPVLITKETNSLLRDRNLSFPLEHLFQINRIIYMGDEGGIGCDISVPNKDPIIVSITHLRFHPSHLVYQDIIKYQKRRVKRLKQHSAYF